MSGASVAGTSRAGLVLVLAAALVSTCDGSSPPAQSGTQLLPGRDFGNVFFWNAHTAVFTRQTAAPGGANQDLWIWPDDEGAPLLALSQIEWSPPVWWSRIIVGDILMTGPFGERVYDLQARAPLDLLTVAAQGAPITSELEFTSVRRDGGSLLGFTQTSGLFVGRGATFSFFAPPYRAWGADFMGTDLAVLASPSIDQLDTELIYRMALPAGDISPLPVPPLGPTPVNCTSFTTSPCRLFRVIGCGADDTVCPETGRAPCAILYTRPDADGVTVRPYVFDVATSEELALPGADPSAFVLSPDRHSAAWLHSDFDDQTAGTTPPDQTAVYVRNFCNGAAGQCSLPRPQQLFWRADGGQLVVDLASGELGLVDVPSATCSATNLGGMHQYLFSPSGDRLAWTTFDTLNDPPLEMLWIGDAAGGEPRLLATSVLTFTFSPDGQGIFVTRASGDQRSLSWLPLSGLSPAGGEQLIADAYSGAVAHGNQRVLVIDHWNGQDASGNLDLVDVSTGAHQVLASAVTDFGTNSSVDGAARLVYAVHGRFASAQDGLWQTTLSAP